MATDIFLYNNSDKKITCKIDSHSNKNYFEIHLSSSEKITISMDSEQLEQFINSILTEYDELRLKS